MLHQQSPAFSSAAATQLPKGQERQNHTWSSGQMQGSLSVSTTKTASFKLQLPVPQNPDSTGKITTVFQSSPPSTNQFCIQHNFQHRAVEVQTPSSFSSRVNNSFCLGCCCDSCAVIPQQQILKEHQGPCPKNVKEKMCLQIQTSSF